METKEFKTLLGEVAKAHGFIAAHGGWHQETPTALFVLNLQKSNYGNYFEFNLKLFLGCGLPSSSTDLKKMVRTLGGDIFRRQSEQYRDVFDLDTAIADTNRKNLLNNMFQELIDHIASSCVNPDGILRLRDQGVLYLLPMAEARLKAG